MNNRGFITIATGDLHYYELAANLLKSYRFTTRDALPFAILCDTQNEYTDLFDVVIVRTDVSRSFMDKLLLLEVCPFEETIFLDSDILAYHDLNNYWELFNGATDFSAIGNNYDLYDANGAWYNVEDIGEYGKRITYKVHVHMGVCFIRKTDNLKRLQLDCLDILSHYDEIHFHTCPLSKDETAFALAMPMNGMKATFEIPESMGFLPGLSYVSASMLNQKLSYRTNWGTYVNNDGWVLHFGTNQTKQPLYRFESECLNRLINNKQHSLGFFVGYYLGLRKLSLKLIWILNRIICKIQYCKKKA